MLYREQYSVRGTPFNVFISAPVGKILNRGLMVKSENMSPKPSNEFPMSGSSPLTEKSRIKGFRQTLDLNIRYTFFFFKTHTKTLSIRSTRNVYEQVVWDLLPIGKNSRFMFYIMKYRVIQTCVINDDKRIFNDYVL